MNIITLIITLIVASGIGFLFYKGIMKKLDTDKKEGKQLVYLSNTGSIVFYTLILLLILFFVIMFIKWKMQ
ncbi:MAG: hypothetical protein H6Q15_1976 [Bacteroidetes bacterium]|nr:hypothetical protein [Bacteroidota bacterium]